jgi:N-acetylglucosaminyldiphosphoundecaprenol N-acetyl-beta-D-mannosaminyltransferase
MTNSFVSLMGFSFPAGQLDFFKSEILAIEKCGQAYHLINSYSLVCASEDVMLKHVFTQDRLLCDGKPLTHLLRHANKGITQIRGADLMRSVIASSTDKNRHFFLGSTDENLSKLVFKARDLNRNLEISGWHSPAFTNDYEENLEFWINQIQNSRSTIVWVGLGTPKQDFVAYRIAKELPVKVIAIGAAFDFLTGNIPEAPRLIQLIGLEWFFRLLREPKRLGNRYILGNMKFIRLMLRNYKHIYSKVDGKIGG